MNSYFSNISSENIVLNVLVIPLEYANEGERYINEELDITGTWIETDIYSRGGIKYQEDQETPSNEPHLRFNYGSVGSIYHPDLDAFSPPKPENLPSWVLDPETALWAPPVPMPQTGGPWYWNENLVEWQDMSSIKG